jgi:C1A family cysteine protease
MSRIYNLKPQKEDKRDYIYEPHILEVPSTHFLSDVQMVSCPILDQGNLGSCVSNAGYALFYILSKRKISLSRLQLYMTSRAIDKSSLVEDSGATIRGCMKAVSKYGLCNEKIWSYDILNFDKLSPSEAFRNLYKLTNFIYTFIKQDLKSIKQVLASGKPVLIGILIYSSFESINATNYGIISMPDTTTETSLGGHAILLVGYDDKTKVFKFQNSWGVGWGDKGYGYIPYDYVLDNNLAFDLCTVTFSLN